LVLNFFYMKDIFTQLSKYSGTALFIFALLLIPHAVFGQDLGAGLVDGSAREAGFATADETTFATTIGTAIRLGLSLVGVLFTVLTLYAGFIWMTARGEEGQVDKAKKTMQNSLIGLFIAVGSYSLSGFVIQAFDSGSSSSAGGGTESGQCCIICQGEGVSCRFGAVEDHNPDNSCAPATDGSFACVQAVPNSGRCKDLEDDLCTDDSGRCVNRKRNDDKCATYL
jgi:hypothetical protein